MAMSTSNFSTFFVVLLLWAAAGNAAKSEHLKDETTTHMHFYMHEFFPGSPNPTDAVVIASLGKSTNFGETRVFDNEIREGNDTSSKLIGRFQGMTVGSSLEDGSVHSSINMVFTEGKYNGSSLALYGRADASIAVNDRPIVGGSGLFRLARGYALSKVALYNATYLILEFDVYVM